LSGSTDGNIANGSRSALFGETMEKIRKQLRVQQLKHKIIIEPIKSWPRVKFDDLPFRVQFAIQKLNSWGNVNLRTTDQKFITMIRKEIEKGNVV